MNKRTRSGLASFGLLVPIWLHAETPVEVNLIDELDEPRAGYCLDTRGGRNQVGVPLGVQGHSCISYQGRFDEDQTFDADGISEGIFELIELDVCMTARDHTVGSELAFEPCDGGEAQRFEHDSNGRIVLTAAPENCVTAGDGPSRPANGGEPRHRVRDVALELCDRGRDDRQRWQLRAQTGASSSVTVPGTYEMTLPDAERPYTLIIPDGYTGEEPVPLIVSLHYGGRVTPFYGRGLLESLIEPVLRDLGAILVGPDSAAGDWANPVAEEHVLELMDYIGGQYNIDPSKTLLTGYSMGGRGTWYLAARHPERFKAAIPIAGLPQRDSTTIDWQTPMYVIHSAADQVLPLEPNRQAVEQLRARGAAIDLIVVDDISHNNVPGFQPYLRAAIPWIQEAWAE